MGCLLFIIAALMLTLAPAVVFGDEDRTEQVFVAGVEDLPLMPGLTEDREAGLVFDKPDGRIVEAYAFGTLETSAVIGFYEAALLELGWASVGKLAFLREGEMLRIDLTQGDDGLVAHFVLSPH